jgi:hypothetical protein
MINVYVIRDIEDPADAIRDIIPLTKKAKDAWLAQQRAELADCYPDDPESLESTLKLFVFIEASYDDNLDPDHG